MGFITSSKFSQYLQLGLNIDGMIFLLHCPVPALHLHFTDKFKSCFPSVQEGSPSIAVLTE